MGAIIFLLVFSALWFFGALLPIILLAYGHSKGDNTAFYRYYGFLFGVPYPKKKLRRSGKRLRVSK